MKKKTKNTLRDARIQNATTGFLIPMTEIPALYMRMEAAVDIGADDAALREIVAAHPRLEAR